MIASNPSMPTGGQPLPGYSTRMTPDARVDTDHIPGAFSGSIFNPLLITVALIYVAWSWVHLPSSIWVRCLFACYLVWRMKPDIIIPFVLSYIQLRIQFGNGDSLEVMGTLAEQLTGYEQYAFITPCVLYLLRTIVASFSVRASRRSTFPFWLFAIYLLGALPVMTSAMLAYGTPGWTGAVRSYCVVSLYFYGLLMPACSRRQLGQLSCAMAVLGMLAVVGNLCVGFQNRQLWVLLPIAGSYAPLLILGGGGVLACISAASYSLVGFIYAFGGTFTLMLLWSSNAFAGTFLGLFSRGKTRKAIATGLTAGMFLCSMGILLTGTLAHDPTIDLFDAVKGGQGTVVNRLLFKLCSDRGPIWWGAMQELYQNPTIGGVPAPQFMIYSVGKLILWRYVSHNLLLDILLGFGFVSGGVLILVLAHCVLVCRAAIVNESHVGVCVLGLAVISNILVGGSTLPYMLCERSVEHMYMAAGLVAVFARRSVGSVSTQFAGGYGARGGVMPVRHG